MPNNPERPVLIYRQVEAAADCEVVAQAFETRFAQHGWVPKWRDTVFDYHHYHSTTHEVLGIAAGKGTLMMGGPDGQRIDVAAGDAIVVPAGVGHCRIRADKDFLVVGAYPDDRDWDICREAPSADALKRIQAMPRPAMDPVEFPDGVLNRIWRIN